jgi:hypothetical protein
MAGANRRRTSRAFLGLVAAVAVTGATGFLISRSQPRPAVNPTPQQRIPVNPGPTAGGALVVGYTVAYDAALNQVVVFGGSAGASTTWIWSDRTWRHVMPRVTPKGRFSAASAYDPQLHMVLLFGGELSPGAIDVNDTWGWNGTTWRELNAGALGPPGGGASSMAWDPGRTEMVLVTVVPTNVAFASETWIWSTDHWILSAVNPLFPAPDTEISWDPVSARLLAVTAYRSDMGGQITGTWSWDGIAWHPVLNPSPVFADALMGLSWDPVTRTMLLCSQTFGGSSVPTPVATWRWNERAWTELSVASPPPVLNGEIVDTGYSVYLVGALIDGQAVAPPVHIWGWSGSSWAEFG